MVGKEFWKIFLKQILKRSIGISGHRRESQSKSFGPIGIFLLLLATLSVVGCNSSLLKTKHEVQGPNPLINPDTFEKIDLALLLEESLDPSKEYSVTEYSSAKFWVQEIKKLLREKDLTELGVIQLDHEIKKIMEKGNESKIKVAKEEREKLINKIESLKKDFDKYEEKLKVAKTSEENQRKKDTEISADAKETKGKTTPNEQSTTTEGQTEPPVNGPSGNNAWKTALPANEENYPKRLAKAFNDFDQKYNRKENNEGILARNRIQDRIIAASNQRCGIYKVFVKTFDSETNFFLGTLTTATAGAGAIFTPVSTVRALSGIAAIISGVRAELNWTYFQNHTIQIITKGLETKRNSIYQQILKDRGSIKEDGGSLQDGALTSYTVRRAVGDAIRYHDACSLLAGLEEVAATMERVEDPGLKRMAGFFQKFGEVKKQQKIALGLATDPTVIAPADIIVAAVDGNETPVTDEKIKEFLKGAIATDPLGGDLSSKVTHDFKKDKFPLGDTKITFFVADNAGNTGDASATVTVRHFPKFKKDKVEFSFPENKLDRIVTTVQATVGDKADNTLTYSIGDGADKDLFEIDEKTGVLTFESAPDFEVPKDNGKNNEYEVIVQVSDGENGQDTQTINVKVTDTNDAPNITSHDGKDKVEVSVVENHQERVTTVTANDTDKTGDRKPKDTLTFTISGTDAKLFVKPTPKPRNGEGVAEFELTFQTPPQFDDGGDNTYEVTIQVSDGNNAEDKQEIAVKVTKAVPGS